MCRASGLASAPAVLRGLGFAEVVPKTMLPVGQAGRSRPSGSVPETRHFSVDPDKISVRR